MIIKELINRINALSKKAKTEGLTKAEEKERKELRETYLEGIRAQFKQQLDTIEVVDE
jgi:uncharacterized protein YnzC (UPF0291/DUF896 family)